jgi:glycosyltransferase involved in cell wall biosynthesis
MKVVLFCDSKLPVSAYDDKERMVWWLGKELAAMGHVVCFLARKDSVCDFAETLVYQDKKTLDTQLPPDTDLVHFHDEPRQAYCDIPYLTTQHDVVAEPRTFHSNTVFLSASQARLLGGKVFVHPGINWSEYSAPELDAKRKWFHFIGNASKKGRNIRGAIDLAARVNARLHVIGGSRVNFRQGFQIPLSPSARFHGVLSADGRDALLNASKGMIFPVAWHEPFNLGVLESLYFGCPVFGTPYGALPELLGKKMSAKPSNSGSVEAFYSDYGCLTVNKAELLEQLKNTDDFDRQRCHEYVIEKFNSRRMALEYLLLYEKVLRGESLHSEPVEMKEEAGSLPLL